VLLLLLESRDIEWEQKDKSDPSTKSAARFPTQECCSVPVRGYWLFLCRKVLRLASPTTSISLNSWGLTCPTERNSRGGAAAGDTVVYPSVPGQHILWRARPSTCRDPLHSMSHLWSKEVDRRHLHLFVVGRPWLKFDCCSRAKNYRHVGYGFRG
jgi:hypothetical protein